MVRADWPWALVALGSPVAGAVAAMLLGGDGSVVTSGALAGSVVGGAFILPTVAQRVADRRAFLADVSRRIGVSEEDRGSERAILRGLDGQSSQQADLRRDLTNTRAMLDAVVSPLLATDAAGVVLWSNRAAREFFASRPTPLRGTSIEELFTQAEIMGQHASALAGKPRQAQVRMPRPEGTRVFQVMSSPFPLMRAGEAEGPQGGSSVPETGVLITLRDVTELATAVQLKTDFVANASHELRTPLSSIRAAVETLSDGAWDEPAMRTRLVGMIQNSAGRLEEMVRDMLDLSRLESPDAPVNWEWVRLESIAASLRDTFETVLAERGLDLEFRLDQAGLEVYSDPKLLTLVLKNLVDNSTKYAYEGTTIRVVSELIPRAEPGTPGDGRRHGLRIRVIDRGMGIPYGHQTRVFERFYQVDPARTGMGPRRGTGLGLAIVKHSVKTLGGSVAVESVWKEGTTMIVELPACVDPERPTDRRPG